MEARDISRSRVAPFEISLRVRHPSIDPKLISRELKVEPEHCFRAGDPRESTSGIAATSVHAESYWLGSLTGLTSTTSLMSGLNVAPGVSAVAAERRAKSDALGRADVAWALRSTRPFSPSCDRMLSSSGKFSAKRGRSAC